MRFKISSMVAWDDSSQVYTATVTGDGFFFTGIGSDLTVEDAFSSALGDFYDRNGIEAYY